MEDRMEMDSDIVNCSDNKSDSVWGTKLEHMKKRVSQIEKNNLKIINRIYHVRRYIRQAQRVKRSADKIISEKICSWTSKEFQRVFSDVLRALMKRLDEHNDPYHEYDTYFDIQVLKESRLQKLPGGNERGSKRCRPAVSSHSSVKHEKSSYEKDPNAPKKPVNAFILFCQQKRTEYLRENPSIAHHDLSKLLAKSWNMLRMEDKQVYYDMYERDKERYEQELEHYTEKRHSQGLSKSRNPGGKSETHDTIGTSPTFSGQSQFICNRDPRISAVISPTLSDSSGISFQLASIPSPTMTSQEEDSFAISNIPSPGF